MFNITLFLIGLICLIKFTYDDLIGGKIGNRLIILFNFIVLLFAWQSNQLIESLICGFLLFILFFYSWVKGYLGGADVKILPAVILLLGQLNQNIYSGILISLFIFPILVLIYSFFALRIIKKDKIVLLPLILIFFLIVSFVFYTIK